MTNPPSGTTQSRLETIETIFKILREGGTLVALLVVLWFMTPVLPRLASEVQSSSISEINVFGAKLSLVHEAKAELEAALKKEGASGSGVDDVQAPEQAKRIADAVQKLEQVTAADAGARQVGSGAVVTPPSQPRQAPPIWVYLGAQKGGAWETLLFDTKDVPTPDSLIRPKTDVFTRERPPMSSEGRWTKGDVNGVLSAGRSVKVLRTQKVPGTGGRDLWWAEVTPQ
jgi:hypothetical protein